VSVAIPGVEDATLTCCLPLAGQYGLPFTIVGRPVKNQQDTPGAGWMSTAPGYYNTFKIPILRGRDFNDHDTASSTPVALINEALARKYWPNEDPIGKNISHGNRIETIIGIVADFHDSGLAQPASAAKATWALLRDAPSTMTGEDRSTFSSASSMFRALRTLRDFLSNRPS